MGVRWEVRCYLSPDGIDQIHAWYDQQSRKVQGKFLSRLKTPAQLDVSEWKLPLFRWLHGDCVPLGEVRFEVQNVPHRPLGYRGPGPNVFTLTFCATEQSNRFVPANACAVALGRKTEIERNPGQCHACWLALE
jgi:hypothetical protein